MSKRHILYEPKNTPGFIFNKNSLTNQFFYDWDIDPNELGSDPREAIPPGHGWYMRSVMGVVAKRESVTVETHEGAIQALWLDKVTFVEEGDTLEKGSGIFLILSYDKKHQVFVCEQVPMKSSVIGE